MYKSATPEPDAEGRVCTKCKEWKPWNCFYRDSQKKTGHRPVCKECYNNLINQYRLENKDKVNTQNRRWYYSNREKRIKQTTEYRRNNVEKARKWGGDCEKRRLKIPKFKISKSMSRSIRDSLVLGKSRHHWEKLAGYTLPKLMTHIEKQFKPGMTWENYGKWHIDHIIPISAFNFNSHKDIDFKKCWALDNLQPLWAEENIRKKDRLKRPFQPSFSFAG